MNETRVRDAALAALFGLALLWAPAAGAQEMSDSYIVGTWATEGAKCGDAFAERVHFKSSGTIEAHRGGIADAAGFWSIEDGLLRLDLLARPELFVDDPAPFRGQLQFFHIVVVPRDVEKDRFEAIGVLGEQSKKSIFSRCG